MNNGEVQVINRKERKEGAKLAKVFIKGAVNSLLIFRHL